MFQIQGFCEQHPVWQVNFFHGKMGGGEVKFVVPTPHDYQGRMWGRDNNCQNRWASVLDYDKVNKLSSSYRVSPKKCDSYCHLYLRPYLCYSFIFIWAEIAGPPVHLYIETCHSDKPFWRYLQIHFENRILKF